MEKLAILGGQPIRAERIPWVNTMGQEELQIVQDVMQKGTLSAFIGRAGDGFLGGEYVKQLERDFCEKFQVKHAITVNSATTALHSALVACEIGPGDEVLVTPYSMVATASVILMVNAVPIFVDIETETYNMDPEQIERWITPHTKAIIVANIFGGPAQLTKIMAIAEKHQLYVIEDNAQAPGASIDGRWTEAIAHLGIFSLNYHKIVHSGEGGVILTNDERLAFRCQLHRNHGEVVVDDLQLHDEIMLGTNYRLTELHAAIGIEQLKKLDRFLVKRRQLAAQVTTYLATVPGLKGVSLDATMTHSYYVYPIQFDATVWGISRAQFARAMAAEGFALGTGYVKPIYLLPMYTHKRVFNQTTYPFAFIETPTQQYEKGLCPNTERMYEDVLLTADVCREPYDTETVQQFLDAIAKVWQHRESLQAL